MNYSNSITKTDKKNALTAGVFFIIAAITSIIGLKLYDPVLNNPDYLILGEKYANQIVLGAFFELILVCTAIGSAIMLYPYLKKYNESWAIGYVCFRMLEAVFILIGTISVLALINLSVLYNAEPTNYNFKTIGAVLQAVHSWTFILGPNFMLGVNTFIYSYVFFKSNLIPKKIALLGMIAAVLIFIAAILEMFGVILQISPSGILLALPIFSYEMTLAILLVVKGFNTTKKK